MLRIIIIFIALNLYNPALASMREDIISKMQITNNLSFNFTQTVDDKSENGKCILEIRYSLSSKYSNGVLSRG